MNVARTCIVAAGALVAATSIPASAALLVTQNNAIAAARTAFGGAVTHDWDANGAPGSVTAAPGSATAIFNYIDGDGFEGLDLAFSNRESFTLSFAGPVKRIGFAVSTGAGLYPTEYNQNGAVFNLTTNTGDSGTLTLAAGPGFTTWATIQSATAFTAISFADTGDIYDQYFGDVFAAAAVPEPSQWALMLGGFGLLGAAVRRRRAQAAFA